MKKSQGPRLTWGLHKKHAAYFVSLLFQARALYISLGTQEGFSKDWSDVQTQRAHSTNLRAVRTKASSSTEGSPPSDDCHGPPIAMKLRSFLRIANLRILQK